MLRNIKKRIPEACKIPEGCGGAAIFITVATEYKVSDDTNTIPMQHKRNAKLNIYVIQIQNCC